MDDKVFAEEVLATVLSVLELSYVENAALREALRRRGVAGQSLQKELKQLAESVVVKRRYRAAYVPTRKLIHQLFRHFVTKEMLEKFPVRGKPQ